MTNTQAIYYLLMGVAAAGVVLAFLILLLNGLSGRARVMDEGDALPEQEEDAAELPVTRGSANAVPSDAGVPAAGREAMSVGGFAVQYSAASDIGARKEQQDAIAIGPCDQDFVQRRGFLTAICDGMGGMRMGAQAANVAAEAFVKAFEGSVMPPYRALRQAAELANERVWGLCSQDDASGAGTTLVCALVTQQGFYYLSVGDSHAYLLRGGVLSQLNVDHNYLAELLQKVRRGEITREAALSDPERAHLTSYLGVRRLQLVDQSVEPVELEKGDRLVLASDGLFKALSPEEIAAELTGADRDSARRLVDAALAKGHRHQDNIAVVVIAVDPA